MKTTVAAHAAKAPKAIHTVGKRKAAIARVFLLPGAGEPGEGELLVNGREFNSYFGRENLRHVALQAFKVTDTMGQYTLSANISGGGPAGQADALKHGIAKALLAANPALKPKLRAEGLLTRDARIVERKKYGHRGARKSPQYSKR